MNWHSPFVIAPLVTVGIAIIYAIGHSIYVFGQTSGINMRDADKAVQLAITKRESYALGFQEGLRRAAENFVKAGTQKITIRSGGAQ